MQHQNKHRHQTNTKTTYTLHYKISMKCTAIKNIENFNPFGEACQNLWKKKLKGENGMIKYHALVIVNDSLASNLS